MTKVEKELLALENRYWQAMKDKDVDAALGMTADPCIVSGAQGVREVDKDSFEAMMTSATWDIVDFEIGDVAMHMVDPDTAIVAYSVHEELTVDGEPVTLESNDASTWIRRDGQWLCALHTESIAGDPYGRDRALTAT